MPTGNTITQTNELKRLSYIVSCLSVCTCIDEKEMTVQMWSLVVATVVAGICWTSTVTHGLSVPQGQQHVHDEASRTGRAWRPAEGAGGGCWAKQLCCQGKNNTCRVDGPRVSNSDSFTCFCDSSCSDLGDCCVDYAHTCTRQYTVMTSSLSLGINPVGVFVFFSFVCFFPYCLFRLCLCMFSFVAYIVHYTYYLIWAPA